jgi:hypothetical protein
VVKCLLADPVKTSVFRLTLVHDLCSALARGALSDRAMRPAGPKGNSGGRETTVGDYAHCPQVRRTDTRPYPCTGPSGLLAPCAHDDHRPHGRCYFLPPLPGLEQTRRGPHQAKHFSPSKLNFQRPALPAAPGKQNPRRVPLCIVLNIIFRTRTEIEPRAQERLAGGDHLY